MNNQAAQTMPLPPYLPEWSRMDNLGGVVPSEVRQALIAMYQRGYAAALSQTAGVAEGWALVPIKITDEMRDAWASSAADDACRYHADDETVTRFAQGAWDAMLAAAPAASGGERVPLSERLYRGPAHDPSGSERGLEPQATSESMPPSAASVSGGEADALPDGTLSKSTVKRVTALAGASVGERARECPACKGAGEVMLPVWTADPQDGYDALGTCPRCGGNGSTFPEALQSLLYFTEHCLSAADEGVDYSTSREWLDAMTTMGVMKKTGRGKWAPSDQAQPVADALRALEQALTQQRGAPYAWEVRYKHENGWSRVLVYKMPDMSMWSEGSTCQPLYTTPQPSADAVRELAKNILNWQPLTSINKADRLYQILVAAGLPFESVTDELESLLGRGGHG